MIRHQVIQDLFPRESEPVFSVMGQTAALGSEPHSGPAETLQSEPGDCRVAGCHSLADHVAPLSALVLFVVLAVTLLKLVNVRKEAAELGGIRDRLRAFVGTHLG
jgi:hypothetical protein